MSFGSRLIGMEPMGSYKTFDALESCKFTYIIPGTLDMLKQKGLIEENEGAQVIFIERKKMPLIVVKRIMHQQILQLFGRVSLNKL